MTNAFEARCIKPVEEKGFYKEWRFLANREGKKLRVP